MARFSQRLALVAFTLLLAPAIALADFAPADFGTVILDKGPTWLFQILTTIFGVVLQTFLAGVFGTTG